jgi:regulation of enolase protein 1 (concanavalin A-like superfamily)
MFNGTATTPTSWNATSITAPVPAGATTGNVVVTVSGVPSNGVSFTVTGPGAPISDDFHGNTLNPMWTFYADCCGFQKLTGTDALLIVPGGTTHDIYSQNKGVGLLQNVADGDFEVEAKFDSIVAGSDQEEGILVKQDAQNFLFFGIYSHLSASHVFAITTLAGTGADSYDQTVPIPNGATSFWVRVKRVGDDWTETWSADGTTYTTGAVLTQPLSVASIGPTAGTFKPGSDPAPNFMAAVDYFFSTASPIVPSDGGMTPPPNQPVFNIWYGDTQTFGQNGIPQEQVNILGNVSAPSGIHSASFTVNGGPTQFLRVGQNPTRLADIGDFNVEICIPGAIVPCSLPVSLQTGANSIVISATDNLNNTITHSVTVNWNNTGQTWPIPYSIDWSTVTNIQDVAQIVDGLWTIQPDGTVHTDQVGYNRQMAIGDVTWTDYQVVAEMTINRLDCTYFGAGLLMGWSGNANDPTALQPDQPTSGQPIFGVGWYATMGPEIAPNAQMTIYANSPNFPQTILIEDNSGFKPTLGVKYIIKLISQRNGGNTASHYTLEIWPSGTPESAATVVQADGDPNLGSVLLIAFHSDVSFGKIKVCATGTTCTLP